MVVDERDVIHVKGNVGRDGSVVMVPMRLVKLRDGLVLHPEGRMTEGGLRISARKARRRKNGKRTP